VDFFTFENQKNTKKEGFLPPKHKKTKEMKFFILYNKYIRKAKEQNPDEKKSFSNTADRRPAVHHRLRRQGSGRAGRCGQRRH
jgi:hypothetical protein